MPRITLDLPESFSFSTTIPLRITDINYGNHLGNDAVLGLVHEARLRFLVSLGFTEIDIAGCGIIMTDAAIVFKSQGTYGQTVCIEIALDDPGPLGCDFLYKLTDAETGKEIARVKTGIVFFDYSNNRLVRMPDAFKKLV
jgi:acyl-CoA thioester hydrolase